jgi:Gram-negative porin
MRDSSNSAWKAKGYLFSEPDDFLRPIFNSTKLVNGDNVKSTKRSRWVGSCVVGMSLAAATTSAHAQSSVTLYGVTDIGLLYTNKNLNQATGSNAGSKISLTDGNQSASRFGLRGVEDLGGGLQAIFTLESGISMSNGSSGIRTATCLAGKHGSA